MVDSASPDCAYTADASGDLRSRHDRIPVCVDRGKTFEARQIMTTTSAGNGASAGDNGGGGGDWSWFAPVRKSSTSQENEGPGGPEQDWDGGEAPSRPVTPIRPVGSGADRRAPGTDVAAGEVPQYREATASAGPGAPAAATPYGRPGSGAAAFPHGREPAQPSEEHQRVDAPAPHPAQAPRPGPGPGQGQGQGQGPGDRIPGGHPPPAQRGPAAYEPPGGGPAVPGSEPSPDAVLIRRTMAEVEPVADAATAYFYALLFVQHPQLRELFPASMDSQRDRLFRAFLTAARLIDEPDLLTEYLSGLGRGHRKYGTAPEHYPAVGECLLGALAQYAHQTWSDETEAAWVRAYTAISQTMIDAAAEDEKHAPAWWNAEIVGHEMRSRDVAVITVRPDQPYPFLAGQYTSLETPWWPRVWRHYSFASAPRSDGLLSFHVKCVPAGWVSSALVNRARQGDVVRLGPPAGAMTVDHASDSGLLCLGGGTGIAPIKALVEDVAEHGRSRPVEVFYGARNDHDLYDLQTMRRLEQQHRWLSVRPVVSAGVLGAGRPSVNAAAGGAEAAPLAGDLPDIVQQYGPWAAYDGYLSGPPGLIRSGVDVLKGAGIPPHRIRHDSLEELAAAAE
jgi:NAD(P)H-flavin reductase/hemoglobin-like flavoprotein